MTGEPPLNLDERWLACVLRFNDRFGFRFVPGQPANRSVIGADVDAIQRHLLAGEPAAAEQRIRPLEFLLQWIDDIATVRPELLGLIRRRLLQPALGSHIGVVMEINTLASLIRKEVDFVYQESPDFTAKFEGHQLGIECASAHYEGGSASATTKLLSVISAKSTKPYANRGTALFIDRTSVLHRLLWTGSDDPRDWDDDHAISVASEFGSIVLFAYTIHPSTGRLASTYRRIDHDLVSVGLRAFLDKCYPIGPPSTYIPQLLSPRA